MLYLTVQLLVERLYSAFAQYWWIWRKIKMSWTSLQESAWRVRLWSARLCGRCRRRGGLERRPAFFVLWIVWRLWFVSWDNEYHEVWAHNNLKWNVFLMKYFPLDAQLILSHKFLKSIVLVRWVQWKNYA